MVNHLGELNESRRDLLFHFCGVGALGVPAVDRKRHSNSIIEGKSKMTMSCTLHAVE